MIWEIGILLAGIGVLILCIFAATMLRDFGSAAKDLSRIIVQKNGEIDQIITHSANITGNIDTITENAAKVTSIVTVATAVIKAMKEKNHEDKQNDEIFEREI